MLFSFAGFQALLALPELAWQFFASPISTSTIQRRSVFPTSPSSNVSANAVGCLKDNSTVYNGTLVDLIKCFDAYTVPADFYTQDTYNASQPTASEIKAFIDLTSTMLQVDGNCEKLVRGHIPKSLKSFYQANEIKVASSDGHTQRYCILHEIKTFNSSSPYYAKGWGLMVVPATKNAIARQIHISAPHPAFDLGTPEQAAAIFSGTGARTLFIAGRSRLSYQVETSCIRHAEGDTGGTKYWITDPAHDNTQPFFFVNKAIWEHQMASKEGCPWRSCAFIQMHAKAASTCSNDTAFLSSGLGSTPSSSVEWYESHSDLPVRQIQKNLKKVFPDWSPALPSESKCSLTATKNIVGRLINGIPVDKVCTTASNSTYATGHFVHIEQATVSRSAPSYKGWVQVMNSTFETRCN